jgi:hypothetical protein
MTVQLKVTVTLLTLAPWMTQQQICIDNICYHDGQGTKVSTVTATVTVIISTLNFVNANEP